MADSNYLSLTALSEMLQKMDEHFRRACCNQEEVRRVEGWTSQIQPTVFLVFLVTCLLSNLFATMIRIYKNSLPVVNVNIVSIINLYIVEFLNMGVTIISVTSMWVSLISHLPFSVSYVLGLVPAYFLFVVGGLAGNVGIIKMMIVLQAS